VEDLLSSFGHIQHIGITQCAQIAGLPTSGGIKGGGIQGNFPAFFCLTAAGDGGGKGFYFLVLIKDFLHTSWPLSISFYPILAYTQNLCNEKREAVEENSRPDARLRGFSKGWGNKMIAPTFPKENKLCNVKD
jgi:hypothetical protein